MYADLLNFPDTMPIFSFFFFKVMLYFSYIPITPLIITSITGKLSQLKNKKVAVPPSVLVLNWHNTMKLASENTPNLGVE